MSIPKIFQFGVIGTANNPEAATIKDVFFFSIEVRQLASM